MGYQGNYPPSTPLTSSQLGAGSVDTTALAADAVATVDIANGAVTIPKLSATGTASSSTFLRGDGAWASAGLSWQAVQTTGFTAVAGRAYPCNTTSAAFTVTLPASPSAGDTVLILDYAGTSASNNITINLNGNKLQGTVANGKINVARQSALLVYVDATQGWLSYAQQYTSVDQSYPADFLVVAGGGSGGSPSGGGGGGGFRTSAGTSGGGSSAEPQISLTPGTAYAITVGAGGAGVAYPVTGISGNNSSIGSLIVSTAGGGGNHGGNGLSGGSGGGAGYGGSGGSATSGQGYAGGNAGSTSPWYPGGGGGGAGAIGTDQSSSNPGNGGNGVSSSINNSATTYAGGGGGGSRGGGAGTGGTGGGGAGTASGTATNGTTNLGGGGGGGGYSSGVSGSGGSGIVIIRYANATQRGTGGTVTSYSSGGTTYWVHTFTSSGTYTA